MKYLLTIFFIFFTTMVFSNEKKIKEIFFEEGLDKYQTKALVALKEDIVRDFVEVYFNHRFLEMGPNQNNSLVPCKDNTNMCRQNIDYYFPFNASSIDLNDDGTKEVLIEFNTSDYCGAGGSCRMYIISQVNKQWKVLNKTTYFGGTGFRLKGIYKNGFQSIFYEGKYFPRDNGGEFAANTYKCEYTNDEYVCDILVKKRI